jgi:hypothetical protein
MPLLNQLIAIFLLRGRPQDLPASPALVWLAALAAAGTALAINVQNVDFGRGVTSAFGEVVLLGAVVWVVLRMRRVPARWLQTITPLYAGVTLQNLIVYPVLLAGGISLQTGELGPAAFVLVAVGIWFLAMMAHVLRHALELGLGVSLLIALACLFTLAILMLVLFPPPLPVSA